MTTLYIGGKVVVFGDTHGQLVDIPADLTAPYIGGKVVVFGDTHGQLADFLLVLQRHGPPSEKVFSFVVN